MQKHPLVLPTTMFVMGIFFGYSFSLNPWYYFGFSSTFAILSFFYKKNLYLLMAIFFFGSLHIQKTFPQNHLKIILKKSTIQEVQGRIISDVIESENRYKFRFQLYKIAGQKAKGNINFITKQKGLKYGQIIKTVAELRVPFGAENPNSFDYEQFLRLQDVYATGVNKMGIVVLGQKANPLMSLVISARGFLSNRIKARTGDKSDFLRTILLGEKLEIEKLRQNFTKAGVSHILAISGLHVGMLAFVILMIFGLFLPSFVSHLVVIIFLIFYVAICDFVPSVSRAALMISLVLICQDLQRKVPLNNIIALSALILLLINPLKLFTISFQLSFLAVIVLANIVPRLSLFGFFEQKGFLKRILIGTLIFISGSMICSFVLNLILSPITLFYFNQINFNSVFSNIFCIPLVGLIVPLSLVVIFSPIPITIYESSLNFLIDLLNFSVGIFAQFPFSFNHIASDFTIYFTMSIFFTIFGAILYKKGKKRLSYVLFLCILVTIILSLVVKKSDQKLKLTLFDCGLGDMIFIETPKGKKIFVDVGPPDFVRSFKRTALPYLKAAGIKDIDYLVLTHAHNDHFGGVFNAFESLLIRNLVVTDDFQTRQIWRKILKLTKEEKCDIVTVSDTMTLYREDDLSLKIVHPDKDFYDHDINNMSIVIKLNYKEFSMLLTGDLEKEGEHYIVDRYEIDTDLLKIGHHGSKSSSTKEFIEAVSPEYAVIFTSIKNRFFFPHSKTLKSYLFLGKNLFITGKSGGIVIKTNGKSAEFKTYKTKREFTDYTLDQ